MLAVLIYVGAIVAANLSVAAFGPWMSPVNSLMLIGLDLTLRDSLHDRWRGPMLWPRMAVLIAAAGMVSYLLNPAAGRIAAASTISFCVAGLVDAAAYHALRYRPWMQRANGSNVAGAIADSTMFPALAFGGFMPGVAELQFVAKVAGGAGWAWALRRWMT